MNKRKNNQSNNISGKLLVYRLILIISIVGLIIPFAAQVCLPVFFPDMNIAGIEIWNQFVSLILGLLATIMSVVSLVLCFRSEEDARRSTLNTQRLLTKMQHMLTNLGKQQDRIENIVSRKHQSAEDYFNIEKDIGIATDEEKP